MARKKTTPEAAHANGQFGDRLRQVRHARFGERGAPELARLLGLPARSWYNYEIGVTVPAPLLLRFLEVTGAEPRWLLHGDGPMFRDPGPPTAPADPAPTDRPQPAAEEVLAGLLRRLLRGELRVSWELIDPDTQARPPQN